MDNSESKSNHLAAYAFFSKLYDSGKNNIFFIVREFIKELISEKALSEFKTDEIAKLLEDEYSLKIPISVIKTSLKKINGINLSYNKYEVHDRSLINSKIDQKNKKDIVSKNKLIVERLLKYAYEISKKDFEKEDEEKILEDFFNFLTNDFNGNKNNDIISSFIIENKNDKEFVDQLNCIREGVIIFQGINYDNTPNSIKHWKNDITIFLETEILFHIAGYNGLLFKEMSNEFLDLVNEINETKGKDIIKLRYLKETEEEVENFFATAESIVINKKISNPSKTAMNSILDGCKTKSQILDKKSDFFYNLNNMGIIVDDFKEYYIYYNKEYNLEGMQFEDDELKEIASNSNYLKLISHINVRRKGIQECEIQNVDYILLSENNKIRKMSLGVKKQEKSTGIPLSLGLTSVTSILWVQLNKGLCTSYFPKTFEAITKAQIVLSKHLNDSISKKFDELMEVASTSKDDELMTNRLLTIRKEARMPEDIIEEELYEILNFITEDSIIETMKNMDEKKLENLNIKNERDIYLNSTLSLKKEVLSKKSEDEKKLIILKEALNKKINFNNFLSKITILTLTFIILIIFTNLILKIVGWDKIEPYMIPVNIIITISIYFFGKEINIIKKSISLIEEKIKQKIYIKNNFKESMLDDIKIEKEKLIKEIKALEDKNILISN